MKVHPVVHFLWHNLVRLLLVAVFLGIPAALVYVRHEGIGFGANEKLARVLSSNSTTVTIGRLALDPFAGLEAREVVLRETGTNRLVSRISNILLSLNLSDLVRGKVTVERVQLRGASLSIPLDGSTDEPRIDVDDVRADVFLQGGSLRLSRFDGIVEGIRLSLTGQLLNPSAFRLSSPEKSGSSPDHHENLAKALEALAALRFPNGEPILSAEIHGDFADLRTLRVTNVRLRCPAVTGSGWALRDLEADGSYEDGVARLPRVALADTTGSLELSVEWNSATGELEAAVLSSVSPAPFLRALTAENSALRSLSFGRAPRVIARVKASTADLRGTLRVTGLLDAANLGFKDLVLPGLKFDFALRDGLVYARDVHVTAKRGELKGRVWIGKDDIRIDAETSIPPTEFLPIMDPNTRDFIGRMEFKDLPQISVSIRAPKLDFANIRGGGHLKIGRTAMRGSWIDSGETDFEIGDRCVTYKNLVITRGEGRGTGTFAYDVGRQEARLNGIRSTLVPRDVLMWIDPKIADAVSPYRFRGLPQVGVEGMVHLKDPTKNNLSIRVDSPAGMEYDLLGKTLKFGATSADVKVAGPRVLANVKRAALMGGTVALTANVSIDAKDPTFGADVTMNRVNFSSLTELYFKYDNSKGRVSGRYKFDARMGQETKMRGWGNIRVEDGNVFAIPVLGPFSEILGTLLPGVAYESARLATADFTVADEKINSKNLVIEGAGFSMYGYGDIYFVTSRLDMSMRLNARGIPGIVFYPMSKLFEYVSTGTVSDPQWRPKIIPRFPQGNATAPNAPTVPPQKRPGDR